MPEAMRKVMVVEDSDDYAFLLSRALNHSRRFQIVWRARDQQEALAYLGDAGQFADKRRFPPPEVVLLDLRLPRPEDGFATLEWILQQSDRPRVVMMTVMENAPEKQKALQAGADDFKVKPYDDEELASFVRWLDEWTGNPMPPRPSADVPPSRTHSQKPASPDKPRLRGSARSECEADRRRRSGR